MPTVLGYSAGSVAGILSVVLYLGSYAALQLGALKGNGYLYSILNILASCAMLISLFEAFNLSAAIVSTIWIGISVLGILRLYLISVSIKFNAEEDAFLRSMLPDLQQSAARHFLNAGSWEEAGAGTELTQHGVPVDRLIYLSQGTADVIVGGKIVAHISAGGYIGELSSFSENPATATVSLATQSRFFCINVAKLRLLAKRLPELNIAIQKSFVTETGKKLDASNKMK
ncbi:MAG: cyclic nucleotide-binding domain-containing protein [Hyphomicrobiales bacterium]